MATRKPAPSTPYSHQRLAEIDAVLVMLRERLDAQPKGEAGFARRARLAVLIAAFERRRSLTEAALEGLQHQTVLKPCVGRVE